MTRPHANDPGFLTTRWSVIRRARDLEGDSARDALEQLCRDYWFPLYAFARRRGLEAGEAEDVVQGFFARMIEKRDLDDVAREKGRFRSYLLAALQHFVSNWRTQERALKRGGGLRRLEFDVRDADERLAWIARDGEAPERAFERAWARELMQRSVADLEAEYASSGRGAVFQALKSTLQSGEGEAHYGAIAELLGMTHGAVKVAAHRLRTRFGERLRERIADTVTTAEEVEDEIRDLFRALGA